MSRLILVLAMIVSLSGCVHTTNTTISTPVSDNATVEVPKEVQNEPQLPTNFRTQLFEQAYAQGQLSTKATPCDEKDTSDGLIREFAITESLSLFETVCFRAAYQSVFVYFLVTDSDPTTAKLVMFHRDDQPDNAWETVTGLTDFANNKLHVSYKGRGLGDCGSQEDYTLEGDRFILERLAEKECEARLEENMVIDPTTWPVTYERTK